MILFKTKITMQRPKKLDIQVFEHANSLCGTQNDNNRFYDFSTEFVRNVFHIMFFPQCFTAMTRKALVENCHYYSFSIS